MKEPTSQPLAPAQAPLEKKPETKNVNNAVVVVLAGQVQIYAVSPNKFRNKFKIKLSSWLPIWFSGLHECFVCRRLEFRMREPTQGRN